MKEYIIQKSNGAFLIWKHQQAKKKRRSL